MPVVLVSSKAGGWQWGVLFGVWSSTVLDLHDEDMGRSEPAAV